MWGGGGSGKGCERSPMKKVGGAANCFLLGSISETFAILSLNYPSCRPTRIFYTTQLSSGKCVCRGGSRTSQSGVGVGGGGGGV